jgi:nucleoside-diphosphate-sugar epimerase
VRTRIPDVAKARELLGFSATVPLEDGIALSLAWHRDRVHQQEAISA